MIKTTSSPIFDLEAQKPLVCTPNETASSTSQCTAMLEPLTFQNKPTLHSGLSALKPIAASAGTFSISHIIKLAGTRMASLIIEITIFELAVFRTQIPCRPFMSMKTMIIRTCPGFPSTDGVLAITTTLEGLMPLASSLLGGSTCRCHGTMSTWSLMTLRWSSTMSLENSGARMGVIFVFQRLITHLGIILAKTRLRVMWCSMIWITLRLMNSM